jgi:TIR domain
MTEQQSPAATRAFISYSWSSATHEAWVLNLASRLRTDGVDAILDKWDLKPGHDSYQFMESMVTDKSVTKVIMVCDKTYVEKANSRSGGVGTESQIISPELYGQGAQDKYAALMTDEDEEGKAHIPVFYKGRIFVDFRSADKFEEKYEELLRWLVDRPQHVKPKLGSVPESILQAAPVATATQSRARRAEEAIRQGSNNASGLIREYGDALYAELKALAPQETNGEPFDETIIKSVASMRPYLRQFAELVATVVRFGEDTRTWDRILAIHEQIGTLMYRSPEITSWHTDQFDAHKLVAHESFLATIALALEDERFELVEAALKKPYLIKESDGANQPATTSFIVFFQYVESLERRNQRMSLSRISLQADMLKEAHPSGTIPSFESLMQADFILYLRAFGQQAQFNWYPCSLVYATRRFSPFPVFARCESTTYFNRLKIVLGVPTLEAFKQRIVETCASERNSSMFSWGGLATNYLANTAHLCTVD